MLTLKLLGEVNNVETALNALRAFSEDEEPSAAAGRREAGAVEHLFSRLPKNPDRNVFLWLLEVTLEISGPVFWWKQFEQYAPEIFTLRHEEGLHEGERLLSEQNFEGFISREKLAILNNYIRDGQAATALKLLPANFVQRRYVKISYSTLREISRSENPATDEHWEAFLRFTTTLPYHSLIMESEG